MNANCDGINTDLKAHPDVFSPVDGDCEDKVKRNDVNNVENRSRIRSNSGHIFESKSNIAGDEQPRMLLSQSYGGDFSSSFFLRRRDLPHASRLYRNHTVGDRAIIPGMSSISHSGYLYKRSNHPHRNIDGLEDQQMSLYDIDPTSAPELPAMPGMLASSAIEFVDRSSLYQQQSILDVHSHQHVNSTTNVVTPSPANNISTTETAESVDPVKLHQQSTFSHRLEQKKSDVKNPIQLGLELGAAFFGIKLKNNGHDMNNNCNSDIGFGQLDGEINKDIVIDDGRKIQPRVTTTTIDSKRLNSRNEVISSSANISGKTRTARRPIPMNDGSSSHQDQNSSTYQEAIHPRQSAQTMLSESPSRSELFNSNPSSLRRNTGDAGIPRDFYDPEDGHLWRAKFCVLEDGILYFYRNANDGNSPEAAAERKKSKYIMLGDDHNSNDDIYSSSYSTYDTKEGRRGSSTINSTSFSSEVEPKQSTSFSALNYSIATRSRRKSSAKDLSKSPMIRSCLHPLSSIGVPQSDFDTCIWEKRVFMDCVGGVRTAEQQYGLNSFELLAMDDDESDQNFINTLILKGQNPTEMKEWIFQFHRSLASFMRSFIDVVGSTSGSGALMESQNSRNVLSSSHSSRHLSSSSLVEAGSLSQSSSEKHLHRLISTSPSLQQTLSHGHGRISLKRRMDVKRAPSESISLSSTPTSDMDYGHHPFAFREPSPNNVRLSPETSSPPLRVLIPPPVQSFIPLTNNGNFESRKPLIKTAPTLESSPRNPDQHIISSKTQEIHRPKPSTSSGKYIPPHQRGKTKYIPPHLRRQQDQRSLGSTVPLNLRNCQNEEEPQGKYSGYSPFASIESSQFTPYKSLAEQRTSDLVQKDVPDSLDVVDPTTFGFIRGGCADPQLVKGSILDEEYIPKKASRLRKVAAEAYGSYGGSFPDTTKKSKSSLRWEIGAISECGIRESNEDAYLIANDLLNAFESSSYGTVPQTMWREEKTDHSVGLFGIFDGHCGDQGARFAVEQLGRFIHDELKVESIEDANPDNKSDVSSLSPMKVESILREAIVKLDVAFCNLCQEENREWESGATALVAMLANENLVIASLGDCRGFLCRFVNDAESYVADDCWEQLEMDSEYLSQYSTENSAESESFQHCFWREVTTVHSPSADEERTRIENANGWITTETEIPIGQLRRMDFDDEDVIGILKRCLHHPSSSSSFNDSERSIKECKAAPQRIIHISRVCGELAVSRALGDRDFKADFNCASAQQSDTVDFDETKEDSSFDNTLLWESPLFLPYPENHSRQFRGDLVTNTPDFHRIQLGTEGVSNEFLLLACDGLWDVMDADDAIRVVRDLLFRKKVTAKKAAARLAELAIHLGSSDNITVVLLRLFSKDDVE